MLLILLYHQVGTGKYATTLSSLHQHFQEISSQYHNVLPGDPLSKHKLNICITFDDAYSDFYYDIFPLLKQYNLKAVLGVPSKFILDSTKESMDKRTSIPYFESFSRYQEAPFCTWEELEEMLNSGHVELASHSHNHIACDEPETALKESMESKAILESKIPQHISTFIYPYGLFSKQSDMTLQKTFIYRMRIGNGLNSSWFPKNSPLLRISADSVSDFKDITNKLFSYRLKGFFFRYFFRFFT